MEQNRLTEIEMALSNQAKEIQDLSDIVYQQGKEIARLNRQLETTKQQLIDIESGTKDAKSEIGLSGLEIAVLNKPPHY
ncbi:MAG: SlyX family protein [Alphaproteobacteria bacterium]|nr:SlyX family protein [Alphaproteobacteria bacterium]